MQNDTIMEVTEETLQAIVARSYELPVIFYFWSEQDPHHSRQDTIVDQLVMSYSGRLLLAKLNCDVHPMLAAQFGLHALPTFYLFKEGQPVDGLQGFQSAENLRKLVLTFLPDSSQLKMEEAKQHLQQGRYDDALALLRSVQQEQTQQGNVNVEIRLLLADTLLHLKQLTEVEKIVATIDDQDQNAAYHLLVERLTELKASANSPELEQLKKEFTAKPNNAALRIRYAQQLQAIGQLEQALALLFAPLETDVNAGKGAIKDAFLEMVNAIGTSNPLSGQYRRQLYTLLH